MSRCLHCQQRKGKRSCSVLQGPICSVCCGQHRGREIACPLDCQCFKTKEPEQPDQGEPRCGLCGKTGKLTKTPCCGNWICDDADQYQMFSYARNSCYRNHDRYTVCGVHHHEEHEGDWLTCEECKDHFDKVEHYVWSATNEYNFVRLENPPAYEPTR